MSDTESRTSRRSAMQQLAAGAAMAGMATAASAQGARAGFHAGRFRPAAEAAFQLGPLGRGRPDGRGEPDHAAKRKAAIATVKEGVCFSMARNAETKEAVDNPAPIVRKTTRTGASQPKTGIASTSDTFFISYHGMAHTHMDSLCHFRL